MDERIRIEGLYKVFGGDAGRAITRLKAGSSKEEVLAETGLIVGLNNVSVSVPSGSIYMIMGLSGSGKSTLARCINRLNEPSAGRILLDGDDILKLDEQELRDVRRRRISMVFQHFALLPNKTVAENAEFGLKLRGISPTDRRKRAAEVLDIVGLSKWMSRLPHELSGGMKQRVGLARALATDADVLIMDEAFSALDPLIRAEMQDELLRLQRNLKKTILFITHDFQEALKLGTRIAIMAEGEVVREGAPDEIVTDPGSDYVGSFTKDVDRARVLDAGSAISEPVVWQQIGRYRVLPAANGGVVLGEDRRVRGFVDAGNLMRLRDGSPLAELASVEVQTVSADTKLLDASRRYRSGVPVVVIDEDGCALGCLSAESILRQIAPAPEKPFDVARNASDV
ncbi:quaternary amine ABC transporter ATP-binding protein [Rhizobium sp. A37_96]